MNEEIRQEVLREFEVLSDKFGNDKLRVRISIEKGRFIDVMFQYESLIKNIT